VRAVLKVVVAASAGTPPVCVVVSAPGCCAGVCWAAGLLLLPLAGRVAPRLCLLPGRWAIWGLAVAAWLVLLMLSSLRWPARLVLCTTPGALNTL
jgi:hypothetical protein